ncbi:hypothetical protein [Glutamicibacter sp. 2E12]|uniref:hypothetical protein n=1 Tax=Glutamicibacter sp. 2E12 TaxID=3416181 RepID=UPI003CEA0039
MSYPDNIHSWTIDWFETLPQAYQNLDAAQKNPLLKVWDGLNASPFDMTEAGGWTKNYDGPAITTVFQQFESPPGLKVHYQIWLEAGAVPGGEVGIGVQEITEHGYGGYIPLNGEDAATVDGPILVEGWFYPPRTGQFIVVNQTVLKGHFAGDPVPDSKPIIKAINVSRRQITYEELPGANLTGTFHPLLRFMDGIGQIGGQYRQLSDDLWDGHYTNPEICPDDSLAWLAQMAGINRNVYRILPPADLRELIKNTQENGLAGLGSRKAIAGIVRPWLSGDKTVLVSPHPAKPHTILIRVNFTEVPNNDLSALAANIRRTRVIPAGHVIEIVELVATWDQWEAAAGSTWGELEAKAKRWGEQDTLGVTHS